VPWKPPLGFDFPSHLLDLNDLKFSRLQGREAYDDIDDTKVNVVLRGGIPVTFPSDCENTRKKPKTNFTSAKARSLKLIRQDCRSTALYSSP